MKYKENIRPRATSTRDLNISLLYCFINSAFFKKISSGDQKIDFGYFMDQFGDRKIICFWRFSMPFWLK